jgi:hypothetical protein
MRRVSTVPAALAAALLLAAPALGAQRPTSRIEGEVTDSAHARPLAGATLVLTPRAADSPPLRIALTDERGRFHFDTLAPGAYDLEVVHPILDSLDLTLPPRTLTLAVDERLHLQLGTPSGATLRAAACPGLQLAKGQGAVVGRVVDADTDTPLVDARVLVSWNDLTIDRSTLRAEAQQRTGAVVVDSLGGYRLCGVPTENFLLIQVQAQGRAGTTIRVSVPEDVGVVLRRLSLSASAAPLIASIDSAASGNAAPTPPQPRMGTAALTGTVQSAAGQPVPGAQVRVLDAVGAARTDSLGHFTLEHLPAGTQLLEVRQVGYLLGQHPVELRSGRSVETSVVMARIVSLDSIRVVARRSLYRESEQRRRMNGGFGRFMDEQEIERRNPVEVSDLLRTTLGFQVRGSGLDAKIISSRGRISIARGECETNIVIDGIQHQDINLLSPRDIGVLEAYSGPAGAPMRYDAACGVIVITTKR